MMLGGEAELKSLKALIFCFWLAKGEITMALPLCMYTHTN